MDTLTRKHLRGIRAKMIRRCYEEADEAFIYYGARGIGVCIPWLSSFKKFLSWAEQSGYAIGMEIDRIDNDGNYEPTNCRWVTRQQNSWNKRKPQPRSHARHLVGGGSFSSQFKGVCKRPNGRFAVYIRKNRYLNYIGTFIDEEEAARAYDEAATEMFGEFACLNFPNSVTA